MSDTSSLLITGGAGYIGSHTCVELLAAGYRLVVIDNLCNSKRESINQVARIAGHPVSFHQVDLRDFEALDTVFRDHTFSAVIHFAGLKAVGESVSQPLPYYANNLIGTINLLQAMQTHGVNQMVFSSSATVYGNALQVPIGEDAPLAATNPYAQTKLMIEHMLTDTCRADPSWRVISLRYFNPAGAHPSGLIGEDPQGIPNNLVPAVTQVAAGRLPALTVHGTDYDTPDGTCIRDYIHVVDLAQGHLAALRCLQDIPGYHAFNLGSGQGASVMEVISTFELVNGVPVPHQQGPRRAGDIPRSYADPGRAFQVLGWHAERDLADICRDAWHWQQSYPLGYS